MLEREREIIKGNFYFNFQMSVVFYISLPFSICRKNKLPNDKSEDESIQNIYL